MCWKCCLCLCNCSVDEGGISDGGLTDGGLTSRGAAKHQDKDWKRATLNQKRLYIHCSSTGPAVIMRSGLDPTYGKEDITINGGSVGKYMLAFPAPANQVPVSFDIPKAISILWDLKEIQFAYCFEWDTGEAIFSKDGYQGDKPSETGFDQIIAAACIQEVYIRVPEMKKRDSFMVHPQNHW